MALLLTSLAAFGDAVPVKLLPLSGDAARASQEFSGMAWRGATLLLMPEDPDHLYALPRAALADAVAADEPAALRPAEIPIENPEVFRELECFDGLEGLAVDGDRVWFVVEARCFCAMTAHVVSGRFEEDPPRIVLDAATVEIPLAHQRCNMAVETMVFDGTRLVLLEEANGANLIAAPRASVLALETDAVSPMPLPAIEYRVTDATARDAEGRFWVSNYLWPGEYGLLQPGVDAFSPGATEPIGPGRPVERLLELRVEAGRIVATNTPPIVLEGDPDSPRNWEGLVRWGNEGFLLVTDAHPGTILGYVPRM
jgi:hypothetical protein